MSESAVCVHVGACGSGKTYRLKLRCSSALRNGYAGDFCVYDVKREWPMVDGSGERGPLLSGSPIGLRRARSLPDVRVAGARCIIVRPRAGASPDEIAAGFDALCFAAIKRRDTIIVAPEAYRYAPEGHALSPGLAELSHEYRHARCGIWLDCQSVPEVKKELLRRGGFWFLHGTGAYEDLVRFRKMGGRALEAAVLEAQKRNVGPPARPGHHVILRAANPIPPFVVLDPSGKPVASFG